MKILGISALYHDSAAALIEDGEIIAAAQEERFSRIKHDNSIPFSAIDYCFKEAKTDMLHVDSVIYYDQPLLTLDRYISNVISLGEDSEYMIESRFQDVIGSRMKIDEHLRNRYGVLGKTDTLYALEHHLSHGASAFYPSPFESAAILTIDGVGEWATTTIGQGKGESIHVIKEIDYPHSLGLLYSAFTSFCGFKVNSGDYKFMGLAPYGEPVYYNLISENIINIKKDGSYSINLDYFDYYKGQYMTNQKFEDLFDGPPRIQESRITKREMNIAASAQKVTEEIIIGLAKEAKRLTGERRIVMAGGVALNCVANGKLIKANVFDDIWIQPAAGDAGGALGCALYAYYNLFDGKRDISLHKDDYQKGSYLGPEYKNNETKHELESFGAIYHSISDEKELNSKVAQLLAEENVVGWFQGRMEFGPRALGNRSILADPRSSEMQSKLNLKIKYRESFRPFAPIVLEERLQDYFDLKYTSPYMLLVGEVSEELRKDFDKNSYLQKSDDMIKVVNAKRSEIPAVTHIDYSARIQTITENRNGRIYRLVKEFEKLTGCGVLVNTSFNVRGEPIVCTPTDAYLCFMRTEMDVLVINDVILYKGEQPEFIEKEDWRLSYALD